MDKKETYQEPAYRAGLRGRITAISTPLDKYNGKSGFGNYTSQMNNINGNKKGSIVKCSLFPTLISIYSPARSMSIATSTFR